MTPEEFIIVSSYYIPDTDSPTHADIETDAIIDFLEPCMVSGKKRISCFLRNEHTGKAFSGVVLGYANAYDNVANTSSSDVTLGDVKEIVLTESERDALVAYCILRKL